MADFRKWFPVLAIVALILGGAVWTSAQATGAEEFCALQRTSTPQLPAPILPPTTIDRGPPTPVVWVGIQHDPPGTAPSQTFKSNIGGRDAFFISLVADATVNLRSVEAEVAMLSAIVQLMQAECGCDRRSLISQRDWESMGTQILFPLDAIMGEGLVTSDDDGKLPSESVEPEIQFLWADTSATQILPYDLAADLTGRQRQIWELLPKFTALPSA